MGDSELGRLKQDDQALRSSVHDQGVFLGLSSTESWILYARIVASKKDLKPSTMAHQKWLFLHVLNWLRSRTFDLGTATQTEVAQLRAEIRDAVMRREISENYAAHIARGWNSIVHCLFGATTSLAMRGFRTTARSGPPLDIDRIEKIRQAALQLRNEYWRMLVVTYIEVALSTGARVGSLLSKNLTVGNVDWKLGCLVLHTVKNRPRHDVVLTERAIVSLRIWLTYLDRLTGSVNRDTPIFAGPRGRPVSPATVNRYLTRLARASGLGIRVTTHMIRRSVGTFLARENARLAAEQLGISLKVLEKHYNFPTLGDRIAMRRFLPGASWSPRSAEEEAGVAAIHYERGLIDKEEYARRMEAARRRLVVDGLGRNHRTDTNSG